MIKKRIFAALIFLWIGINPLYIVHAAEQNNGITYYPIIEFAENQSSESDSYYDERKAIVAVSLIFTDQVGKESDLKMGYGFFVGDAEKGVYLITCYHTVVLSESEREQLAVAYELDPEQVNVKILIHLKNDVTVEAGLINGSESMDFAVLKPASDLSGCTTLRLCENTNVNESGAEAYTYAGASLASANDATTGIRQIHSEIDDWMDIDGAHYYRYYAAEAPYQGLPLFNNMGEVIGFHTNEMALGDDFYAALQISEVIDVLDAFGIVYNSEIIIDTSALEEVISQFEGLEKSNYTNTSFDLCEEKYEAACDLLETIKDGEIGSYTQELVDLTAQELDAAIASLEKVQITVKQIIMISVIAGTIMIVAIAALVIILILNNRKYKLRLKKSNDEKQSAEDILKLSGRITPGIVQNRINNLPLNRTLSEVSKQTENACETTVLNVSDCVQSNGILNVQPCTYPRLIRMKTGESVIINKNYFILGKSPELVDYCIQYNSSISRKHACIMRMEDGYYLQDLNTTNGTYVDDIRVSNDSYVKLVDGSIIKMAEEKFVFKE